MIPSEKPLIPVRLCCGQRHFGVVCPDGLVMCCICYVRVKQSELAVEHGETVDMCKSCKRREMARVMEDD